MYIKCGRVFFTISIDPYVEDKEPTALSVASRIGAVVATTLILGPASVAIVGTIAGMSSVRGCSITGVYADGRMAVVRGRRHEETGVYELYIAGIENRN